MTRAILCDIEGTIGSIGFVKETLFPYAAQHLPDYVREHQDDPAVRDQLNAVARISQADPEDSEGLITQLLEWIDSDNKATPLKTLQGMIWVQGYASGDYQAHVYDDAYRKLTQWREQGFSLHIFSSGSVQAQKLFFRYSCHGDMRLLFTGWFDTSTGPKHEPSAYSSIASMLDLPGAEILFLSDTAAELDAAAGAGMRTTWVIRPDDSPYDIMSVQSRHTLAASFDEVRL